MCKTPLGTRYGLYCLPCGGWTLCSGKEHVYSLVYVCLEQDMWDISWCFGVILSLIIDYWQGMFRFPSSWPKNSYHHQNILVSFWDGGKNEGPQGDTLSPYLLIIFLKPIFRWLGKKTLLGYHLNTSSNIITTMPYVDDLVILTYNI